MCEAVFRDLHEGAGRGPDARRDGEVLIAVVMRAPDFAARGAEEAHGGRRFPFVESTTSSSSAQGMRWSSSRSSSAGSSRACCPETRPDFETALAAELPEFPELWAIDGTSLDRVAHRLKAVRGVRAVVIPGSVLAMLDLRRGVLRRVVFREKLLTDEVSCLARELDEIPKGTMLVMDRGFAR
jgi:hypothetical protein